MGTFQLLWYDGNFIPLHAKGAFLQHRIYIKRLWLLHWFGLFNALIGGYISDRYWGNRKSIITGGILMALGQFALATSSYLYTPSSVAVTNSFFVFNYQTAFFLIGLFLLVMGNGFFKPNISSMVGLLYQEGDDKRDSAFTIFYMGINLGALIAPIIIGGFGDTGNPANFMYGFLTAGCGMLLGLTIFILGKKKYLVDPDGNPVGGKTKT